MARSPERLSQPFVHRGDGGRAVFRHGDSVLAASSVASPARPESNEDALLVMPAGSRGVLLAVADGCGGMPAADRASAAAVAAMASSVGAASDADLTSAVLSGFDRANAAVADLRVGAGSTLTAVLVQDGCARVFHAGDSPAAIVGQRGAIRFATLSHSLVGFGVEAGLISAAEAQGHEDSGVVLNVLGFAEMFVHVGPPVRLRPMDTVLIASDGLSDNLTIEQISSACRVGGAAAALEALVGLASDAMTGSPAGHADDLSVALFRPTSRSDDERGASPATRSGRGGCAGGPRSGSV